jgi:hypothetical protein
MKFKGESLKQYSTARMIKFRDLQTGQSPQFDICLAIVDQLIDSSAECFKSQKNKSSTSYVTITAKLMLSIVISRFGKKFTYENNFT